MAKMLCSAVLASMLFSTAAASYRGNVQPKVFHAESCRCYGSKNCTAVFQTGDGALEAGYCPVRYVSPEPRWQDN